MYNYISYLDIQINHCVYILECLQILFIIY